MANRTAKQLLQDAELVTADGITYAALILLGTRPGLGRHLAQAEVVFEYRATPRPGPANQRDEFRQGFLIFYEAPRNRRIAETFARLGLVERAGQGVGVKLGGFWPLGWLGLAFVVLEVIFFATSRDTLQNTTPAASNCWPVTPLQGPLPLPPSVGGGSVIPPTMKIRRRVPERLEPRGVTPCRLAAAERTLTRERQRLALFARQVLAEQETAENHVRRIDADNLRHDQAFRDLAAKHWREGRRMLRSLPEMVEIEVVTAWNRSSIPPDAAYFVDFLRTRVRRSLRHTPG